MNLEYRDNDRGCVRDLRWPTCSTRVRNTDQQSSVDRYEADSPGVRIRLNEVGGSQVGGWSPGSWRAPSRANRGSVLTTLDGVDSFC